MSFTPLNSLDLPMAPSETRVVVAMSGGVDSSVVAALLKDQGYDVTGITLQLYDHGAAVQRKGACCAGQDIHDARRVADRLGIPHYVLDYEDRFREAVIDRFADSYLAGETPIPCVECNRTVKFADLLRTAVEIGAHVLATGHYVSSRLMPDGRRGLFRAADPDKDQTYFLYATTQPQLDMLRFPLGGMNKTQTRELARHYGLAVAEKSDSQDICFVPNGGYAELIRKLRPEAATPGDIVHLDGRVLGRHDGIIRFTVGQRRGLGLSGGDPLYVVALDAANAQVIVGPRAALLTRRIKLRDMSWIGDGAWHDLPAEGVEVAVRVRSTRPPAPAVLYCVDGVAEVELAEGEEGVAPGQACVIYDGAGPLARVLGGGVINRAPREALAAARQGAGTGAGAGTATGARAMDTTDLLPAPGQMANN